MKILIDNGHGAETRGKRSPDGRLLEYRENRIIARGIVTALAARGWCAYTTRGATRADALATCLYEAVRLHLPGMRLRTDYTDADPDLEKDFYVLRHTLCPSVLVENLFMDNPSDCAFLLSEEGQQSLVDLHVDGICDYKSQILIWPKPNL